MRRHLAAGALAGLLTGWVCALYLAAQNPVGGLGAELQLVAGLALIYALVLALPLALGLLGLSWLDARRPFGRRALVFGDDFAGLLGTAVMLSGFLVAGRRLLYTAKMFLKRYVLPIVVERGWKAVAALVVAVVVGYLVARLFRAAERRWGTAGALGVGLGVAAVASLAIVLVSGPAPADDLRPVNADAVSLEPPARRVALLGFDGLDPEVMAPLLEAGEMPHFAALARGGTMSALTTLPIGLSPPIWTTIATGARPIDHGIHDFVTRRLGFATVDLATIREFPRGFGVPSLTVALQKTPLLRETLITPAHRRAPAVWTLASLAGVESLVVDWLGTWPSERIAGAMVSDRAFILANLETIDLDSESSDELVPIRFQEHGSEVAFASGAAGLCHPEPGCRDAFPAATRRERLHPGEDLARFHHVENRFYLKTARRLLATGDYPLVVFYSHLPDFLNHLLHPEELENVLAGVYETENEILLLETYREVDRTLGRLVGALGPDYSVLVVSDHGVEVIGRGIHKRVAHVRGPPGVFLHRPSAAGERTAELGRSPSVYDVAPTALALLGLPLTSQMPGQPIAEVLAAEHGSAPRVRTVAAAGVAAAAAGVAAPSAEAEAQVRERLESLGYLD